MSFVVGFVGGELIPHIIAHLLVDSFWEKAQDRTCAARPSAPLPPVPLQADRVRRAVPRTDRPSVGIAPVGITIRSSLPGRALCRHRPPQPTAARTDSGGDAAQDAWSPIGHDHSRDGGRARAV